MIIIDIRVTIKWILRKLHLLSQQSVKYDHEYRGTQN
jgi:hypothetical protein